MDIETTPGSPLETRLAELTRRMDEIDNRVKGLAGPHVSMNLGAVDMGGQIVEGPHAEVVLAEGPPPGQSVAEWVAGISGSPGIVVDPGIARVSPCIRIELGDGMRPLVFSKGIIGALDEEQQALYCEQGYEERPASERQRQRLAAMREASQHCSKEATGATTSEHIVSFFSCIGRELRAKGVEA